jgi:hypothetical protein
LKKHILPGDSRYWQSPDKLSISHYTYSSPTAAHTVVVVSVAFVIENREVFLKVHAPKEPNPSASEFDITVIELFDDEQATPTATFCGESGQVATIVFVSCAAIDSFTD